jgi:hypothetical protein
MLLRIEFVALIVEPSVAAPQVFAVLGFLIELTPQRHGNITGVAKL